ncbi:hypothetical protein BJY01DRAFT_228536 [Aspergillus pseudoustus]|uniref:N-acetylgalactosaminide beta-1,3-galactosyltransferase n=1 Tax=Aspergillus pseudoustus TaxID=1810923 RepID=A0ABR4INK3_9EURO
MLFSLSPRAARRLYIFASLLLLLDLYALYARYGPRHHNGLMYSINGQIPTDCPQLPGLSEVMLVLKTGVTEAHDKLPIHRNTTLRCIPNYVVWSDFSEEIADIPVHDVLYNESATLHQLPDFKLYTKVQTHGRDALTPSDLGEEISTPFGKSSPGWKLDKWKFLPMIEHTLAHNPAAKWYVFMEADTYVLWPNMLSWLAKFDPAQPWYLGNQMQIRDVVFAHGGSGFVLSRPAMEAAVSLLAEKREHWDKITRQEWAGDCVLGILLKEAGIKLTWAWPMLQIAPPKELDNFGSNYGRTPWCYPAVSFHHLKPREIRELNWVDRMWTVEGAPLLYRDVFWQLAWPKMTVEPAEHWDNQSGEEKKIVGTLEECRKMCEEDTHCLQYVMKPDGMCAIGRDARLGDKSKSFTSGWMLDRIEATAKTLGNCPRPHWILK